MTQRSSLKKSDNIPMQQPFQFTNFLHQGVYQCKPSVDRAELSAGHEISVLS